MHIDDAATELSSPGDKVLGSGWVQTALASDKLPVSPGLKPPTRRPARAGAGAGSANIIAAQLTDPPKTSGAPSVLKGREPA